MGRVFALGMLASACLASSTISHATSLKDVQVGIRTMEFLRVPPRGRVDIAVLYDSQRRESEEDAVAIIAWLRSNVQISKAEIAPVAIDIRALGNERHFAVAIVAGGISPDLFNRIFDYSRANGTLTITADLACVHAGKCTMGISSSPRVEVILSRAVAQTCGIDFLEAFRMMIKEEH